MILLQNAVKTNKPLPCTKYSLQVDYLKFRGSVFPEESLGLAKLLRESNCGQ
jgi:hypothetical protein